MSDEAVSESLSESVSEGAPEAVIPVLEYEQPLSKYAPTCNKETLFKKFLSSGMHGVDNISEVDGTYAIMQPEGASKVMIIEHLCSTERHAESDLLRVMKSHYKDRTSKPADAEKEDMCMYLNRSCCAKCAEEIIAFCSSHRAKLEIVCASLSCCRRVTCYECNKDAIGDGVTSSYEWNTIAMKKLLLEADIHFRAFVYEDWKKLRELINSSDYDHVKEYSETDYDEVINETGVHDKLFYGRSREDIDMARDLEALKKEAEHQKKRQKSES